MVGTLPNIGEAYTTSHFIRKMVREGYNVPLGVFLLSIGMPTLALSITVALYLVVEQIRRKKPQSCY